MGGLHKKEKAPKKHPGSAFWEKAPKNLIRDAFKEKAPKKIPDQVFTKRRRLPKSIPAGLCFLGGSQKASRIRESI